MRATSALFVGWILVALAGPLAAQDERFFDAVEVRISSFEVIVTDKEGQPILDLGPEDFTILEDGVRQEIIHFGLQQEGSAEVSAETPEAGLEGSEAAEPAPERTQQLHLAIFVDDTHLSSGNRNRIFEKLDQSLASVLKPGDQVLIARLAEKLEIEQNFSSDSAQLSATLDRLAKVAPASTRDEATYRRILRDIQNTAVTTEDTQPDISGGTVERQVSPGDYIEVAARTQAREILAFAQERLFHTRQVLRALQISVDSLAGLRGRKALIFLTDGLPVRPGEGLGEAWREKYEMWARQSGASSLLSELSAVRSRDLDASDDLDALADRAATNRVAFYVLSPGSPVAGGHVSAEYGASPSEGGGAVRTAATVESFASEGALLELAEKTGGVAKTRSFQIENLLKNVRSDFSTFYSLAYRPAEAAPGEKAAETKLEVKVARKGAVVRHAQRAAADDPTEQLRALTLSALYHGLTDNPLQVELAPQPGKKAGKDQVLVEVLVQIPFEKLLLLPQENNHVGRLTLFVAAQDPRSQQPSAMNRVEIPLKVPNDQILEVLAQKATYPLRLEMSPGPQRLAIGLRDQLARVSATVFVELEVREGAMAAVPPTEQGR